MHISVSVIIVTYNRGYLLASAIESILHQNFHSFELIIIDDSSTDNTNDVIKPYLKHANVTYIKIPKSNSIAQARNAAWKYTRGNYVAVLDSDDLWCDELKLAKQFEFLEKNPSTVLVGSGAILIGRDGKDIEKVYKPEIDSEIRKGFLSKNPFFHSSVMYRRAAAINVGGYDESILFGEDLDLWLKLGKVGSLYNLQETLIKYRVHDDNEASKHHWDAVFHVLRIIKKNRQAYGFSRFVFLKKIFSKIIEYIR